MDSEVQSTTKEGNKMKNWEQLKHKIIHRNNEYGWTYRSTTRIERFLDQRTLIRVQCKKCGAWWYELL